MTQIHGRISAARSAELTELKNTTELDVNKKLIGRSFRALATENGKDGTITRTNYYRPVVVRDEIHLGEFVEVTVTEAKATYLIGTIKND